MKRALTVFFIALITSAYLQAQVKPDKGTFVEYEPGFYQNSILKDVRTVEERKKPEKKQLRFTMDMSGTDLPNKVDIYKSIWHNPPVSQGNTGTCWCFSTTSFFESEVYRLQQKEIKLSEMFTVYWEYIEKAREYVKTRGESPFPQGSEANAVTRMFRMYGIVPYKIYTGLEPGRLYHTHEKMMEEMEGYLKWVKENNAWNTDEVLSTIRSIMDHYMGAPPSEFEWEGKKYSPKTFLNEYLKLNPDDYADVLSYMQEPYWKQVEYKVPDNWWHSDVYYNVPLDVYMQIFKKAVQSGYTMSIGGDVSEAGFDRTTQCALVPTFDIPSEYIDETARQFRFSNRTTTDDHGMHVVGWIEKDGKEWYLVKDSSSGSRNNDEKSPEFGYYFFSEDYVKLKMMDFCVHKDMLKEYLKKF
ncbi:MAG: peptidase C1 [Bacteroidetes bacterium]|nr:peptidase C1 [Bacteroidota bacterium]